MITLPEATPVEGAPDIGRPGVATIQGPGGAYAGQLFARGYVCRTGTSPPAPAGWLRRRFGDHHLAHDPRLAAIEAEDATGETAAAILCLGLILDIRHPQEPGTAAVARLARSLAASEAAFFEDLAHMGGRHVLLHRRGAAGTAADWIVADATGMKPIFRSAGPAPVVASHPGLVAAVTGARRQKITFRKSYPGLATPYEDVLLVTPNSRLDLAAGAPARFWPDPAGAGPLAALDVAEAAARAGGFLQATMDHLAAFHDPIVSVTAGLDSRVTLATTRNHPTLPLFTYFRQAGLQTDSHDRGFAEAFAAATGRPVRVLLLEEEPPVDPAFLKVLKRNLPRLHVPAAAWAYRRIWGDQPRTVHVRSNLAEIGREFYSTKPDFALDGPEALARLYLSEDHAYPPGYREAIAGHFAEFDRATGLLAQAGRVDLRSLFYWEFRMAGWHGAIVVAESDPAFDTVSLYNCRRLLETLLAVPAADRREGRVHRRIVADLWPELTRYPVNGARFHRPDQRLRQLPQAERTDASPAGTVSSGQQPRKAPRAGRKGRKGFLARLRRRLAALLGR